MVIQQYIKSEYIGYHVYIYIYTLYIYSLPDCHGVLIDQEHLHVKCSACRNAYGRTYTCTVAVAYMYVYMHLDSSSIIIILG